ncbi:EpsG family protein [Colwellia sp. MB3u-4]|uniref:EpsG family protein n=1 Tax=Colwellia sp. MB3u-4 TaxID=2759822 RepID=UPI0015F5D4F6|nr:EpsG family protein [Colwellia sp. MB3u-4]MBA6288678.1 EpsG family protein [Colwellia sp. MB3u-4]
MDLVVYYERYIALVDLNFVDIHESFNSNFGVIYLIKLIEVLGFPKEFIPFIVTTFSYIAIFKAIDIIVDGQDISKSQWRLIIITTLLVVSFVNSAIGLRSGLSTSLFLMAIAYGLKNEWWKFYLIGIISIFIHVFIALGFIIIILVRQLPKSFSVITPKLLIFSPLLIFMGLGVELVVNSVSIFLPKQLAEYVVNSYILHESWGHNAELNWKTKLVSLVFMSSTFYASLLYLSLKKSLNNDFELAASFLILFVSLMWGFFAISERYKYLIQLVVFLLILYRIFSCDIHSRKRLMYKTPVILFFMASILSTSWGMYRYKVVIKDSYHFLAQPFLFSFFNEVDINNLRYVPAT